MNARLKYLHEAAHVLSTQAPTTSAILGAQFISLTHRAGLELPVSQRQEICGGCGSPLLPGWSCETSIGNCPRKKVSSSTSHIRNTPPSTASPKIKIYKCRRCHRETRLFMQNRSKTKLKSVKASSVVPGPVTRELTGSATASSANVPALPRTSSLQEAANKKRSRNRKQTGLQALLAKNKADTVELSRGLDLMDFMKGS